MPAETADAAWSIPALPLAGKLGSGRKIAPAQKTGGLWTWNGASCGRLRGTPRKRMDGQRAVGRHEAKILDLALGEQQPVERIARVRLGLRRRQGHAAPSIVSKLQFPAGTAPAVSPEAGVLSGSLPSRTLDRDLPQACDAGMENDSRCSRRIPAAPAAAFRHSSSSSGNQNIRVEKKLHSLRQRPEQKVFRQRIIKIIRHVAEESDRSRAYA